MFKQSIGATGGGQAHPARDASGLDPIAGKNEPHTEDGCFLTGKKFERSRWGDSGGKRVIEDKFAGSRYPLLDLPFEFRASG